jgi:predicted DNA-binding transcriptional regulator AlpA
MSKKQEVFVSISLDELMRLKNEEQPKVVLGEKEAGKRLMTHKAVEVYLEVSRQTVYNWRKAGLIPEHKIGSKLYFFEDEIANRIRHSSKDSLMA